MKVLLDEQILTIRDMNWLGIKNGELLKLLSKHEFTVFITNDKNLYYQQNISQYPCHILNINTHSNRYDDILIKIDIIKDTLLRLSESQFVQNNYIVL